MTYNLQQLRGAFGAGAAQQRKERRCGMCRHFCMAFCLLDKNRELGGDCMNVADWTDASECPDFSRPNVTNLPERGAR